MKIWILMLAVGFSGCVVSSYETSESDGEDIVAVEGACISHNPCMAMVLCDWSGSVDEPACHYRADGSCHRYPVSDGTSCFPTTDVTVGVCRAGTCVTP